MNGVSQSGRRTSVVVLITLAELAWIAAFGLLFAYRGKVGELGRVKHDYSIASSRLDDWEKSAPEKAELLKKIENLNSENSTLKRGINEFQKLTAGAAVEEVARKLDRNSELEKRLAEQERELGQLKRDLMAKQESVNSLSNMWCHAESVAETLRQQFEQLPPNAKDLARDLADAHKKAAEFEAGLKVAQAEQTRFTEQLRQREIGEFSVRRELTGLPDGNLGRVVFLVDTSSSMRNSPAWGAATNLVRTWLEFLPVQECALVNFNDAATGYPKEGYHRVRTADGAELPNKRNELLKVFDRAGVGTFTDLLKGLRLAYRYPRADVMVLFTDGHPHVQTMRDPAFAREIFDEVKKHPDIPILTVALGSYETEGSDGPRPKTNAPVAFLKELAKRSGGNFLGR